MSAQATVDAKPAEQLEVKTILDLTIERLRELPLDKLLAAKEYVEFLHAKSLPKRPRRSLEGTLRTPGRRPITREDIDEARREMWGGFNREDI